MIVSRDSIRDVIVTLGKVIGVLRRSAETQARRGFVAETRCNFVGGAETEKLCGSEA